MNGNDQEWNLKTLRGFFYCLMIFLLLPASLTAQQSVSLDSLKELALDAQKTMDRVSLDSIADVMLLVSKIANNSDYTNQAHYFKSDAISRSDPRRAIELGTEALRYFESKKDHYSLSRIYNVLGHCYSNIGEHLNAVQYYNLSVQNSELLANGESEKEKRYRSRVNYNSGFALVRRGDLHGAMQLFTKSHVIAEELGDTLVVMSIRHQYGNIKLYREDYEEALLEFKEAARLARLAAPTHVLSPTLGIASVYQQTGQRDSAIFFYEKVIQNAKETSNITTLCVALTNVSELYVDLAEYDKGIEVANELISYSKPRGIKQHELNGIIALLRAHMEKGDLDTASKIVDEALSKIDANVEFDQASNIYMLASKVLEHNKEYKLALDCQKNYKLYSDSLLNQESLAKIDELELRFESDKKDSQIQKLETENQLSSLAFKQQTTLLGSLLVGSLLLILIVYLFINRQRLILSKQKENVEQRLLRSQMNPHFIFNAISSIQNYLYDKSDLKVALNYMSKFAELMRQILENSREEYVPLHEEIRSLQNYLDLQKLRYSNSFGYDIIVDSDLDVHQILVPPLISQPFVENAIEHGMIYRIENGLVKISFTNNNDKIELLIEDNGVGSRSIEIEPKKVSHKKKSLATIITNERLQLLSKINKSKFEMAISSHNEGTLVSIQLPKIRVV